MEPTKKHPKISSFLDTMSLSRYGRKRFEAITQDICVRCGEKAESFRDELSKKEFSISGYCQECQGCFFTNNYKGSKSDEDYIGATRAIKGIYITTNGGK